MVPTLTPTFTTKCRDGLSTGCPTLLEVLKNVGSLLDTCSNNINWFNFLSNVAPAFPLFFKMMDRVKAVYYTADCMQTSPISFAPIISLNT